MDPHPQSALVEPFDSFWEAPDDIESGYERFGRFYRANYPHRLPEERSARILCVSCGPGYLVNLLVGLGYRDVLGIDSFPDKIAWAKGRNLPCEVARAFEFLEQAPDAHWDVIFCEQELNHLTRTEIVAFLRLCQRKLRPGGTFVCFALNGANPIAGAEGALAQCQSPLSLAGTQLEQLEGDLVAAQADLAATGASLAQALGELAAALADGDADGVRDTADACPETAAPAAVDGLGCSQAQFCSAIPATTGRERSVCNNSDWGNDEPLANDPQDCRASGGCARRGSRRRADARYCLRCRARPPGPPASRGSSA